MKLCLVKQACSTLTIIQDVNNLIYDTYKGLIRPSMLTMIINYYNARYITKYTTPIDIKRQFICTSITFDYTNVFCWSEYCQKYCKRGVVIEISSLAYTPGICYDCFDRM